MPDQNINETFQSVLDGWMTGLAVAAHAADAHSLSTPHSPSAEEVMTDGGERGHH